MNAETFLEADPRSQSAEDFLQSEPTAEEFLHGAVDRNADRFDSAVGPTPEKSAWQKVKGAVREGLAPLIGPTDEEVLTHSTLQDGEMVYKPAGSKVDQEGLFPGLSHPMVPIPKIPQQKGKLAQVGAGLGNTAIGFLEFMESPLGLATAGVTGLGSKALSRTVAGGYAADMASKVPESARQFGESTVNGTLQQQVEKGAGLGSQIFLPAVLGKSAISPEGRAQVIADRPKAELQGPDERPLVVPNLQEGTIEEALAKADEAASAGAPVQTSGLAEAKAQAVQSANALTKAVRDRFANSGALSAEKFLEQEPVSQLRQAQYPTVEVPLKELQLSKDVPNFKADADAETGVVEGQELQGKYERLGTGAITAWERLDGTKEVVSGRHRFDLARRAGEKSIPTQIIKEADGWTKEEVQTLDAEMNIRDGQGSVSDYANYFRSKPMEEQEAADRGLLSRAKGQAGWALGKMATDDLYALYRGGKIKEDQAIAIATAAPGEAPLQRVGSQAALNGMVPQELRNFIQAVRLKTKTMPVEQLDLFGADDAAMNEAQKLAKVATDLQRELDREIKSTDNTARNAAAAQKKGDPQEILSENAQLRVLRNDWNNWALKPELVSQVLRKAGVKEEASPALIEENQTPAAEVNAPDRVEAALDKLKIDTGGQGALLEGITGLPVLVWNGSLEVVRAAYRAGKTIVEAAKAGLEWIREKHPDLKFDEAAYIEQVTSEKVPGERQFPKKVDVSEDVSQGVKGELPAETRFYDPRSNEVDADWARRTIGEQGIPGAITTFKDETNGLPGAQRTALGLALIKGLGLEERAAAAKGDKQAESAAIDAQVDLVDHVAKRSTDIAQSLQAMSMWARMTPAGHLRAARKVFAEAGQRTLETLKPALDAVRGAIEQGNAEAATEVTRAPEIRTAVEDATAAAIAGSRETHTAVIVEVAGTLGESPEILRQIRDRVRDVVHADERTAQEQRLKNLLGEHYLEVATKPTAARPLAERLKAAGVKGPEALAKAAEREFKRRAEAEKAKLTARVKKAREERPLGMLSKETEIDRAIRKQLRQAAMRLDTIVKWHYTKVDKAQTTLAARLVSGLGLSHDGASYLATRIQQRFQALAAARKRALLERLGAGTKARLLTRPGLQQRLIELSNLGAFTEEKYYNAVREKLGLPVFTDEIAREITRRANQIQDLPEGFRQQRATIEMMNYIQRQKGIKWHELAMPFWFANILSGPMTHLVNGVSNAFNLGAHIALEIAKRPLATPAILQALAHGALKGPEDAGEVLKTGIVTGTRIQKLDAGRPLELKRFTGWATPLNAWKYVYRALAAEDLLFFKAAEEMRAAVAARVIAKREGVTDSAALARRTAEILGTNEAAFARAEEQAHQEGLRGLDYHRRVSELVEQSRPNSMREDARQYGLKVTFNNEPYGALGVVAQGINAMTAKLPGLRFIVPFTNIVANVANESLSYLPPVGFYRAIRGSWSGELDGRPITSQEQLFDQYAKAAVGLAALSGLAVLAAQHQDEETPTFAINGAGPRTPEQRRQLKDTGWIPYSFKVGRRYVSYAQTPLAIPVAILGNYMDALKYKHLDKADLMNRVAYATATGGRVITEQSFLSGLSDLFRTLQEDNTKTAFDSALGGISRTVAGFVVPNALKQIDQIFDSTVYDGKTIQDALINQVPFARRVNQPAINVLGDPVRKYISSRFLSEDRENELLDVLAAKQAWVPVPNRETIVGDKKRGEDYFRTLTPAELYDYTKESGQAIQDRLWSRLDRIRDMESDQAKKLVHQITEQEREKAKKQFR